MLHKARVRRNHGRLPSNGFIESAPEHRARAHFLTESALPIKRYVIRPQSAIPQWTFQLPITGLLASLVGIHIYE
jgi:hypothetical protein